MAPTPFEGIAELENLPTQTYIELPRRLLLVASFFPTGETRPRVNIPITVILFIVEYDYAAQEDKLGNSHAAGLLQCRRISQQVAGTGIFPQRGVDICFLKVTHLESDYALWITNYVCYWTNRLGRGGDITILVRKGIYQYTVPVSAAHGSDYHIPNVGRQTSEGSGGLPVTSPTRVRVRSDRVPERGSARLGGGRFQREAPGLKFSLG